MSALVTPLLILLALSSFSCFFLIQSDFLYVLASINLLIIATLIFIQHKKAQPTTFVLNQLIKENALDLSDDSTIASLAANEPTSHKIAQLTEQAVSSARVEMAQLDTMAQQLRESYSNMEQKNSVQQMHSDFLHESLQGMTEATKVTTSNIVEIFDNVVSSTGKVNDSRDQSATSSQTINQVNKSVLETADRIESLSKEIQQIEDSVSAITEIASQTDLLALNAAIEAARAGEFGRGFAVVAEEVRNLAHKANSSATNIQQVASSTITEVLDVAQLMHDIREPIQQATESTNNNLTKMNECSESMESVLELASQVIASMQEQEHTAYEANKAAAEMKELNNSTDTQGAALLTEADLMRLKSDLERAFEAIKTKNQFSVSQQKQRVAQTPDDGIELF
ncbi:hypothetical protein HR060_02665 [Catenovulum sp. SM1970]|uniref:methyl-accepting chemotaxis protein n=1 Tax=Marinifaba aquimaris TaxID=2741323 RepID=UPI001573E765|nr:methyl-accepting chemotaxis protein [Marinifaba aquimaris]NTS75758.1 hypothetical protein [Marinifaba aquimaris]